MDGKRIAWGAGVGSLVAIFCGVAGFSTGAAIAMGAAAPVALTVASNKLDR